MFFMDMSFRKTISVYVEHFMARIDLHHVNVIAETVNFSILHLNNKDNSSFGYS